MLLLMLTLLKFAGMQPKFILASSGYTKSFLFHQDNDFDEGQCSPARGKSPDCPPLCFNGDLAYVEAMGRAFLTQASCQELRPVLKIRLVVSLEIQWNFAQYGEVSEEFLSDRMLHEFFRHGAGLSLRWRNVCFRFQSGPDVLGTLRVPRLIA